MSSVPSQDNMFISSMSGSDSDCGICESVYSDGTVVLDSYQHFLGRRELLTLITCIARDSLKRIEEASKLIHFSYRDMLEIEEKCQLLDALAIADIEYEKSSDIGAIRDQIEDLYDHLLNLVNALECKLGNGKFSFFCRRRLWKIIPQELLQVLVNNVDLLKNFLSLLKSDFLFSFDSSIVESNGTIFKVAKAPTENEEMISSIYDKISREGFLITNGL